MERAWDGRGGEREDIDREAHPQQFLFVLDAEALLFIDDDEAQISEVHVLGEDAVRADEDVDLPLLDPSQYVGNFRAGLEA